MKNLLDLFAKGVVYGVSFVFILMIVAGAIFGILSLFPGIRDLEVGGWLNKGNTQEESGYEKAPPSCSDAYGTFEC